VPVKIVVPIQTVSEANQSEHWTKRHKRKKSQQMATTLFCRQAGIEGMKADRITLTRIAKVVRAKKGNEIIRGWLDDDNLAGSFKHCQDSVAKELGIDDAKIKWTYRQREGDEYSVEIEIIQGCIDIEPMV
jgi:hypothetical protein